MRQLARVRCSMTGQRMALSQTVRTCSDQTTVGRAAEAFLLTLVILAALALRLNQLGFQSLSVDEATDVLLASRPVPEMMRLLVTEHLHPPLYPLLLHYWMALAGNGETSVRLPSVLAGVGLVPLIYVTARRLESLAGQARRWASPVGTVASLLAAFSAFYVGFSQEASGYMAATFLALLSCFLLLRALPEGSRKAWIAYAVATLASVHTEYTSLLMVVFQAMVVILVARAYPASLRRWALSVAAVVVACLPWIGYSFGQGERITDYLSEVLQPETALGCLLVVTPGLYLALGCIIVYLFRRSDESSRPVALRLLLPAMGIAALAATLAISAVHATTSAPPNASEDRRGEETYGDYRGLVSYVEDLSRPNDAVVLMRNAYQPYLYYEKKGIPWYPMEPFDDFDGAITRLNQIAQGHSRLWFVLYDKDRVDPADYVMHVMESQATEERVDASFGGLGLRLFDLSAGHTFSYYPTVQNRTEAIFGGLLEFWGWNQSASEASGNQWVQFDLHWRPL
ncbi:MAG: glycosyltransferase family 39 protein, partial [Actinobacteria bacterium]|nr:glycosyltransferase family 39 protein [Actinomycetota bacterium]